MSEFLKRIRFVLLLWKVMWLPVFVQGEVRLVAGRDTMPNAGRVEIWDGASSQWATVCDDGWSFRDVQVVCRELGYPGATMRTLRSYFGAMQTRLSIGGFQCSGSESNLMSCVHSELSGSPCDSGTAGAICKAPGYIGCFQDYNLDRILQGTSMENARLSVGSCLKYCSGNQYAGIKYRTECHCDDYIHLRSREYQGISDDMDCWYRCTENAMQTCGGSQAIEIYNLDLGFCSDPGIPDNGTRVVQQATDELSFYFGTIISFTCKPGFRLEGQTEIQCKLRGSKDKNVAWSGSVPKCITQLDTHSNQPSEPSQPTEASFQTIKVTSQLIMATSRSIEVTSQPIEVTSQPIEVTSQPINVTSRSIEATSVPIEASSYKTGTTQLVEITSPPIGTTFRPTRVPLQPLETHSKPIGSTSQALQTVVRLVSTSSPSNPRIVWPLVIAVVNGVVALVLFVACVRQKQRNRRRKPNEQRHEATLDDRGYQVPLRILRGRDQQLPVSSDETSSDMPLIGLPTAVEITSTLGDHARPFRHASGSLAEYGNVQPSKSFPRDLVVIEKEVGRGAFGRVMLATALGIKRPEERSKVAVKTLKEGADRQAKLDLLQELDVMSKIGSHPNIVRLLGYCTETDPIYIIVEYLPKGDLKRVLLDYRASDTGTGYVNIAGISQSLSRTLVKFALDVANGMAFLASQKCIHRDLAARNVLVGEDMVCKVSDFGLARDVINVRIYQRKSQGPLPMRWMALESLLDDVYTTKSDVWSFGVLVWEIVTLGARPYLHIMTSEALVNQLRKGYRMPKPNNCKQQLYTIMRSCWDQQASRRPSFSDLVKELDTLMKDEMDYITTAELDKMKSECATITHANEKL